MVDRVTFLSTCNSSAEHLYFDILSKDSILNHSSVGYDHFWVIWAVQKLVKEHLSLSSILTHLSLKFS
jgi:hypothetical protein